MITYHNDTCIILIITYHTFMCFIVLSPVNISDYIGQLFVVK